MVVTIEGIVEKSVLKDNAQLFLTEVKTSHPDIKTSIDIIKTVKQHKEGEKVKLLCVVDTYTNNQGRTFMTVKEIAGLSVNTGQDQKKQ